MYTLRTWQEVYNGPREVATMWRITGFGGQGQGRKVRSTGALSFERLERRVLLSDVSYYEVLKGRNFGQVGDAAPVLGGGDPFHLHAAVEATSAISMSGATLRTPAGVANNFTLAAPQHFTIERSFANQGALDASFANGDYRFAILHPMDVNFAPAPGIDVSACVGQSAGSRMFSSQVLVPDGAGDFHEVWSPLTPDTLDADGHITATQLTATLKCHGSGTPSVDVTANWTGSQYEAAFNFGGQALTFTVPEGFATGVTLTGDAYPNAPHITNSAAAGSPAGVAVRAPALLHAP